MGFDRHFSLGWCCIVFLGVEVVGCREVEQMGSVGRRYEPETSARGCPQNLSYYIHPSTFFREQIPELFQEPCIPDIS